MTKLSPRQLTLTGVIPDGVTAVTQAPSDNSTKLATTAYVDASGGTGDVTGPASSTNNALVRFDGTTGKLIQNSANGAFGLDSGLIGVGIQTPLYPLHVEVGTGTAINGGAATSQRIVAKFANKDVATVVQIESEPGNLASLQFKNSGVVLPTGTIRMDHVALAMGISLNGGVSDLVSMTQLGVPNMAISGGLKLNTTTDTLLVPRLTTAQKTALTPVNGDVVYDTDLDELCSYINGSWVILYSNIQKIRDDLSDNVTIDTSDANITLTAADNLQYISIQNTNPIDITATAGLAIGTEVYFSNDGLSTVTVTDPVGEFVISSGSLYDVKANGAATLKKIESTVWILTGDRE